MPGEIGQSGAGSRPGSADLSSRPVTSSKDRNRASHHSLCPGLDRSRLIPRHVARRREAIPAITTGDRSRLLCKTPHDHVGSSQDANRLQRGAGLSHAVIRKLVDAKDFRLSTQCASYYLPRTPIGCNAGLGFRSPLFGNYWRGMTYGRQCNACPCIANTTLAVGPAAVGERDGNDHRTLSLPTGHQQVEQDRASAFLPHHSQLARSSP